MPKEKEIDMLKEKVDFLVLECERIDAEVKKLKKGLPKYSSLGFYRSRFR